jgi:hypothetical protein
LEKILDISLTISYYLFSRINVFVSALATNVQSDHSVHAVACRIHILACEAKTDGASYIKSLEEFEI